MIKTRSEIAKEVRCQECDVACFRCKYRNEFHIMLWCDLWHSRAIDGGYGYCNHFDKDR